VVGDGDEPSRGDFDVVVGVFVGGLGVEVSGEVGVFAGVLSGGFEFAPGPSFGVEESGVVLDESVDVGVLSGGFECAWGLASPLAAVTEIAGRAVVVGLDGPESPPPAKK
jgi:hypothetical protein